MTKLLITLSLLTGVCSFSIFTIASDAPTTSSSGDIANEIANEGAAVQGQASTDDETEPDETTNTNDAASDPASSVPQLGNPIPQDTLGGSGLKNKKLSDIFEQFVPSETISADNAVPFPTDM